MTTNSWPALPLEEWKNTYATLHMWTQIVGKIRLALAPPRNHWWNTTLYVTPRGLTTSSMPYNDRLLQIDFDFIDHMLVIETNEGSTKRIPLRPRSVAEFYKETMAALQLLGMHITIWTTPVEVPDRTPFEEDFKHVDYDPEYAQRVWRILAQGSRIFSEFSSRFIGKVSPVHFFWGAFDLAVTRFSGRTAPLHPGAPNMARFVAVEAYSHEVVVVSAQAEVLSMNQFSMLMPILNLKDSRTILFRHQRRSITQEWESSFCHMMLFGPPTHLIRYCCLSCRVVMKQKQCVPSGIVIHWSVSRW